MDGAEEVHRPLVVPRGDGSVLLQLGEEVLDQVTCLVEVLVVGARRLAVALGRDHRRLACLLQRLEHPLFGIIRFVGDQRIGREVRQQGIGTFLVMRLPGREGKPGRVAERVHDRMDLGAQATAAAPDRFVAVFLTAPALC